MNLFVKKGTFEIFLISVKNLFKSVLSSKFKKKRPFKKKSFPANLNKKATFSKKC